MKSNKSKALFSTGYISQIFTDLRFIKAGQKENNTEWLHRYTQNDDVCQVRNGFNGNIEQKCVLGIGMAQEHWSGECHN